MKKIEVRLIQSSLTHQIRHQILWPHKNFKNCFLNEDRLETTFHVGVFYNKEIVSVGTFIKTSHNLLNFNHQYRLRAMGTKKKHQGKSMGRHLILFAKKILKEKNIQLLWCDARKEAIPFYKKLKFKVKGEFYEIPKIGLHKLMYIYI